MLSKRKLAKGKVRVTFTAPAWEGVTQLNVAGDFNNWSTTEHPLAQGADGSWSAALSLDGGKKYQYRFVANGSDWRDDEAADEFSTNEYGSRNCIVNLEAGAEMEAEATEKSATEKSAAEKPAPKKKAASKKKSA